MKPTPGITFFLGAAILLSQVAFSQVTGKSLKKSNNMYNQTNKETIRLVYDLFNKRQFEKLAEIISADYTNPNGSGKGIEAFQKSILSLAAAFPDAHWNADEIIADGNKVVVRQKFTGTQTNTFQNIRPTNKTVSVDGFALYELRDGKIIFSLVQTDRLGFLQQLGVLPVELPPAIEKKETPKE